VKPHVIRLRGPWDAQLAACDGSPDGAGERLASLGQLWRWLPADFQGQVAVRRRFGCPPQLASEERVVLVIPALPAALEVRLNDEELGAAAAHTEVRFDIRRRLAARNELVLRLSCSAGAEQEARHFEPGVAADESHVRLEFSPESDTSAGN
jgi:hypothetical protein